VVSLESQASALADAIDAVLPDWVERCVRTRLREPVPDDVLAAARAAGEQAVLDVGGAVRRLLEADVDDQRGNPLALLRGAVRYPTEVLRAAGAPAVDRDRFSTDRFPDDDYDLTPATWSDLDPSLVDLGIAWGAAKAFVHRQRHAGT
jgi:hypothetical protein